MRWLGRRARWFANRQDARTTWLYGVQNEGTAAVWRAKVAASDVLGYFAERNEDEIIVDPASLYALDRLS